MAGFLQIGGLGQRFVALRPGGLGVGDGGVARALGVVQPGLKIGD